MKRTEHLPTHAFVALLVAALAVGCGEDAPVEPRTEPAHVSAQHVLIGFGNSVPGRPLSRTRAQADSMSASILQRAVQGEDFDSLVVLYTDDAAPGIYGLANHGVTPGVNEYARASFVQGFGDLAFVLEVGQFGRVGYDSRVSPYGYHVLKRLE